MIYSDLSQSFFFCTSRSHLKIDANKMDWSRHLTVRERLRVFRTRLHGQLPSKCARVLIRHIRSLSSINTLERSSSKNTEADMTLFRLRPPIWVCRWSAEYSILLTAAFITPLIELEGSFFASTPWQKCNVFAESLRMRRLRREKSDVPSSWGGA